MKSFSNIFSSLNFYRFSNLVAFCPARLLFYFFLFITVSFSFAQTKSNFIPVNRILFILDASSSMQQPWGYTTKIDAAKKIISQLMDSLQKNSKTELALRVYGHQSINTLQDCNDSKLEVPFGPANVLKIKQVLNGIRPKGITPMALSLQKAAQDFPDDANAKNFIILVTDGAESCNGDPCAVSLQLQQKHISLKPFIIGLNLSLSLDSMMQCMGNYFNAREPEALKTIVSFLLQRILSNASVQINLLDINNKPIETDVNMTFYDAATGAARYNFYHTLNYRGLPDTLQLDAAPVYNLSIHTIPPIQKKDLKFSSDKKEVIDIPASQGFLKLQLTGSTINNNLNQKIKCIVRKAGSLQTIFVQDINSTQKLLCGNYDLEFLTLPRIQTKNLKITQSTTTTIQLDAPGVLSVTKSIPCFATLFSVEKSQWVKIYEMDENLTNEFIGLQPGNYVVEYRPRFSKRTTDTIQKIISITSGKTTTLTL